MSKPKTKERLKKPGYVVKFLIIISLQYLKYLEFFLESFKIPTKKISADGKV
jgi:hypothetical protein